MFRHDLDWLCLFCGLIFLVLGLAYIAGPSLGIRVDAVWALPSLLLALGVAGLIGTARRPRRRDGDPPRS